MVMLPNKDDYAKYSKSEKRVYWGFVVFGVLAVLVLLAWKPLLSPLLK